MTWRSIATAPTSACDWASFIKLESPAHPAPPSHILRDQLPVNRTRRAHPRPHAIDWPAPCCVDAPPLEVPLTVFRRPSLFDASFIHQTISTYLHCIRQPLLANLLPLSLIPPST
jgi:hypothetical protein